MLSRRGLLLATTAVLAGVAHGTHAARRAPAAKAAADPEKAGAETATPVSPAETPVGPVDTAARWALIIDYNTGATLLAKDADVPMPPSSMTKLMTAYIVYSLLKSGRLKLDESLPVSERAWRMGGSKMFVQIGTQVKVEDLIRGMIVQSGNDACIVLAEGISGSVENFVDLIREIAKGATVLLIEHNMPLVMRLADRITVFNAGAILAEGTPGEIRADQAVQEAYLGTAHG